MAGLKNVFPLYGHDQVNIGDIIGPSAGSIWIALRDFKTTDIQPSYSGAKVSLEIFEDHLYPQGFIAPILPLRDIDSNSDKIKILEENESQFAADIAMLKADVARLKAPESLGVLVDQIPLYDYNRAQKKGDLIQWANCIFRYKKDVAAFEGRPPAAPANDFFEPVLGAVTHCSMVFNDVKWFTVVKPGDIVSFTGKYFMALKRGNMYDLGIGINTESIEQFEASEWLLPLSDMIVDIEFDAMKSELVICKKDGV